MTISETDNYEQLVELFIRNELEFSEDEPVVETDIVKCWKAEQDGELIGGCVLAKREGHYIIDGIAVEPQFRKDNVGRQLLDHALQYLKQQGSDSLYLVARAPGFFKKQGFITISREDAPNFFECFTCSQYNKTCFPEVMKCEL